MRGQNSLNCNAVFVSISFFFFFFVFKRRIEKEGDRCLKFKTSMAMAISWRPIVLDFFFVDSWLI